MRLLTAPLEIIGPVMAVLYVLLRTTVVQNSVCICICFCICICICFCFCFCFCFRFCLSFSQFLSLSVSNRCSCTAQISSSCLDTDFTAALSLVTAKGAAALCEGICRVPALLNKPFYIAAYNPIIPKRLTRRSTPLISLVACPFIVYIHVVQRLAGWSRCGFEDGRIQSHLGMVSVSLCIPVSPCVSLGVSLCLLKRHHHCIIISLSLHQCYVRLSRNA